MNNVFLYTTNNKNLNSVLVISEDIKFLETLKICNESSEYALTGAVITQDRAALQLMMNELKHAAGNFYINDKLLSSLPMHHAG